MLGVIATINMQIVWQHRYKEHQDSEKYYSWGRGKIHQVPYSTSASEEASAGELHKLRIHPEIKMQTEVS